MTRQERAFKGGTRVRFDAPGYRFHRLNGTVAQDTRAESACEVLVDGRPRGREGIVTVATNEVARLRDQTPNPDHGSDFSSFWWLKSTA